MCKSSKHYQNLFSSTFNFIKNKDTIEITTAGYSKMRLPNLVEHDTLHEVSN
jgi:hypothetical protein